MDKTIADIIDVNPNDNTHNYSFCILQIVLETFGHSN